MYEDGLGVEQDYNLCAKWFLMAAENGDAEARFNLANLYRTAKGVPLDYVSAYIWYSLAASRGHARAQHQLKDLAKLMTPRQREMAESRLLDRQ